MLDVKAAVDISFIILTWNSAAYIRLCLDSIQLSLKADTFQYEVIVIDNGSIDQTTEILREFQEKQPTLIKPIFLSSNQGTTVPRNRGLEQANGRLLCVMDSDVVLSAGLFEVLVSKLDEDQRVGIVVPKILYPSGNWQKSFDQFPTLLHKIRRFFRLREMETQQALREKGSLDARPVDYAISAFWLFKRELFDLIGYLDEKIFYSPEDVDFCLRVWKAGHKIIYDPSVCIVHHAQEISRGFKVNRVQLSHLKGLLYLYWKHNFFFTPPKFAE